MAYMSQENKKTKAPRIKAICKRYGCKVSIGVRHHSTLVVNIPSGDVDFVGDRVTGKWPDLRGTDSYGRPADPDMLRTPTHLDINQHWWREQYQGRTLAFLADLMPVLMEGNHDNSDIQTDYFDVGWYIDINIGSWDKPYIFTGKPEKVEMMSTFCRTGNVMPDTAPRVLDEESPAYIFQPFTAEGI